MKFLLFVSTFAVIATALVSSTKEDYIRKIDNYDLALMTTSGYNNDRYYNPKPTSTYESQWNKGQNDQL